ncbi:hypothetical protein L0P54_01420 [Anaerosalibacter bizertensis]|uniref:Uncharacterized protein n=1 Tax=Anaerosalibacter bizertensis TaxID=932217 RepID=A0A9Q4FKS4_9FIRM|nr:hypothetical protein [Anaerosalibacter bizertensis]MBV1818642.1 hypothetical protein [Bacteroidales bacterium MSK.15.36]MCG4564921.1 hypothetical protein [Anaerosalibacter bizertensis]MCG4581630.1 hypothetical protein [Anaerosalibacter bizertensis]
MKKNKILTLLLIVIIISISSLSYGAEDEKTLFILVDEMDFELMEEINNRNFSTGMMNSKSRGSYDELSYVTTIATGRKVKIKEGDFEGLKKEKNGSIKVVGYQSIIKDLNKNYPDFSKKIVFFGEKLKGEGIAYIGEDSSSIIACDKNGIIKNGEIETIYEEKWLKERTESFLKDSNILVLSYDIEGREERISLLNKYLEDMDDHNIVIIPKKLSDNMKKVVNSSLVPIMYKAPHIKPGILTSDSTKRKGIVTNLDIFPQIMSIYDVNNSVNIGKSFKIYSSNDPMKDIKTIYKEVINMTYITYIFHGIVYFIQVYFTYFFIKNRRDKYRDITFYYNFLIITIFISFILGFFNLHRSILAYLAICLMISYSISTWITDKKLNGAGIFSTLTYITMIIGIVFYPESIYNSYMGYNNLIAGARYYGFNNGAMGILLASSIISYFTVKKYLPNKALEKTFSIVYGILNIVILSSRFGVNTGGFFTSIVLFLIMIYTVFFEGKFTFKNAVILGLLGFLILYANLYIDLNSLDRGHAGSLIYRAKILGRKEVYEIIVFKLKELFKFTISPPWIIVLISQIFFIKSFWNKFKERSSYILEYRPEVHKEYFILLITAIVAFFVNDTGVIAFIYMIQYLLVLFVNISIAKEF